MLGDIHQMLALASDLRRAPRTNKSKSRYLRSAGPGQSNSRNCQALMTLDPAHLFYQRYQYGDITRRTWLRQST